VLFCCERKVLLADCWWLIVVREKYRWLVADKPSEQGGGLAALAQYQSFSPLFFKIKSTNFNGSVLCRPVVLHCVHHFHVLIFRGFPVAQFGLKFCLFLAACCDRRSFIFMPLDGSYLCGVLWEKIILICYHLT
jgi:hypothetical protein